MQARTVFRLAMLNNGYTPTLNDGKRPIEHGWPRKAVDEAEILSWDRSACLSTGLRLNGDLAVIDVDVSEAALIEDLARAFDARFPQMFTHGLTRHAGGIKEAWIARVDAPFRRLASRRWHRGADPDDAVKHMVECFGSLAIRQFAINGPRDRNSVYQFTAGASPATVPLSALPILPGRAFAQACDLFDAIAKDAGLTAVRERRGEAPAMIFELEATTIVDTDEWGPMTVAELERLRRNGRCSGTFHDPTRRRPGTHLIGWGRLGLSIWDAMTEQTWRRRDRAPSATFEFLGQLRERGGLP
jgi:hypothetical protein